MKNSEELLEIIGDLIKINKDRVVCYVSIIHRLALQDAGLREMFTNKANESRMNAQELAHLKMSIARGFADHIVGEGKIYRVWKEANNMFGCEDCNLLLGECECGEAFALEAYKTALTSEYLNDYPSRKLIMDQKFSLQTSQDLLKKYCDLQELVF